jgi:drug/metabolite transporter (DMT)-like permease
LDQRNTAPYLWMIAGCFFTAWMGQFAHLLKNDCDWRVIALVRGGLAFAFAFALAKMSGAKLVVWRPRALWLRGCASSISLLCTFYALSQIRTSEVMTLTNTFPIWVALLSWPLLRTRPTLSVWAAAGFGVLGVALIQSPHFEGDARATLAIALSLTAAATSAVAMLGLNRLKQVHPWAVVTHYSGVATLFVLGSWAIGGMPDLSGLAKTSTLLLLLAVGIAATLGQLCVTRAFTAGPPARVAVVGLTQIIFALALDFVFDAPGIATSTIAGIALVLLPTAWMMAGNAMSARASAPRPERPDTAADTPLTVLPKASRLSVCDNRLT